MNLLNRFFTQKEKPSTPPVYHGNAQRFKAGDKITCITSLKHPALTAGYDYEVLFAPSQVYVPLWDDNGNLALVYPDHFL